MTIKSVSLQPVTHLMNRDRQCFLRQVNVLLEMKAEESGLRVLKSLVHFEAEINSLMSALVQDLFG